MKNKLLLLLLIFSSIFGYSQSNSFCFNFTEFLDDFTNDKFPPELKKLMSDDPLGAEYMEAWNYLKRGDFDFNTRTNTDLVTLLQKDVSNTKYNLKEIFESDPNEILIWKQLKDDPFYSGELIKETTDSKLLKWKDREFFKAITKKGNDFEIAMLNKVKTRTGPEYEKLNELIPDIDQRKLVSQMQFCLPGYSPPCNVKGEYFVADQVWIKYDDFGDIENMIVVDTKLSEGTALTTGQTIAKNHAGKGSLSYKSLNEKTIDETKNIDLPEAIQQGTLIEIKGFYKLYGDGNKTFKSVKKLD